MKTFYFNTGVRRSTTSYAAIGDLWKDCESDYVRLIPFDCDNVPDNAEIIFLCDDPNLLEWEYDIVSLNVIVREIHNTTLLSKYAYFRVPVAKQ